MTVDRGALTLLSPISGVVVPLDEVPDPAFAQRLAGDGVSIDPLSDLVVAPAMRSYASSTEPATQ